MENCLNVQLISDSEYIGDSLNKINTNFGLLSATACQLQQQYNSYRNIRTFFYYGPNAPTDSSEGTYNENTNLAYPSTSTITRFVTGSDGLDLLPSSKTGDVAWVVYQKTGWASQNAVYSRIMSGEVPYTAHRQRALTRVIGIGIGRGGSYTVVIGYTYDPYTAQQPWTDTATIMDSYNQYAPAFVLYKLIHNGTTYVMDGNPRFTRAQTASTDTWIFPELWNTY
jgi:hypothetical protein